MVTSDGTRSVTILQRWWLAIRPRTLPAAASPVLIGWAIAWVNGVFRVLPAIIILFCALLLQILANLVNDVADYQKGTDKSGRLGPTRVTQSGLLSIRAVWTGAGVVALLAAAGGLYLAIFRGWPVLVIGGVALICAVLYTVGPFAFEDYGLGDLAAFLFFGFVTVCGTTYILLGYLVPLSWLGGLGAGALVTAILVVNNVRDIESDKLAGRKNIPVRWGRKAGEIEYTLMMVIAYVAACVPVLAGWSGAWILLPLISIPRAIQLVRQMRALPAGAGFNLLLANTAQLVLIYCVLFALGIVLDVGIG
jgi:1,4-dihydroxy-2-naphthoate octaprenyltransferase